jgi:hypothetical protein
MIPKDQGRVDLEDYLIVNSKRTDLRFGPHGESHASAAW